MIRSVFILRLNVEARKFQLSLSYDFQIRKTRSFLEGAERATEGDKGLIEVCQSLILEWLILKRGLVKMAILDAEK